MKSRIVVILISILYVYIFFNRFDDVDSVSFKWDKLGYYSYLPATFIYHDLKKLSFYPDVISKHDLAADQKYYALYEQPNGNRLNKYSIGVAILEWPGFWIADTYVRNTSHYDEDGFSTPYQVSVALSGILFTVLGLIFLRLFLNRYYTDAVTALTLLCIGIGTNLYYYTAFDFGMSHQFSFGLFAAMLYFTERWHRLGKLKDVSAVAVVSGFIVIVRPVNILVLMIPLLWGVYNLQTLKGRMSFYASKYKQLLPAAILFVLVLMIQFTYWKTVSGKWVIDSYQEETFDFAHTHIIKGLFGYRKGWFVYTPLAFVGMLGFFSLWKQHRQFVYILLAYFSITIYLTFSWYSWWYGGGFGARALIESLAVLSLPLAAFIAAVKSNKYLSVAGITLLAALTSLNMFQVYQAAKGTLPYDLITRKYYWRVFGKVKATEEDRKYLMTDQDYISDFK